MDRDTGSIGGIEKPPQPSKQLFYLTILLDILAILLSILIHPWLPFFLLLYIGASKAYSYRGIRLKKFPVAGYLTVILFQGALTFALVYFAGSDPPGLAIPWQGMVVCALLVGGFYPLTQIYQHKQDFEDGVKTISYQLGYRGTFIFCSVIYLLAWVFMAQFFISKNEGIKLLVISIFFIPVLVYFIWWFVQVRKLESAANFKNAMRMNWIAATCTNLGFITLLTWNLIE
jgi:1,4-dihydroxy-2-naphthoate octaprenyltransferase